MAPMSVRDAALHAAFFSHISSTPLNVTTIDANGRPRISTVDAANPASAAARVTSIATDAEAADSVVVGVQPQQTVSIDATATDPGRGGQWALNRLDFESLWDRTTAAGVCVAIIDTGIQSDHPDLVGHLVAAWDATGQGVADGHGHGTHVAGIVAATPNNALGVAGAAPNVELLVGKVLRNDGVGEDGWAATGIIWAVDHGAEVVNLSLGTMCPETAPTGCESTALRAAIDYAQSRDVVVVAAAGNSGDPQNPANNPWYQYWSWPAAFDWPIAVAATTSTDQRASFSTQGSYVDVAAPGASILSTFKNSSYATMSGTSMATPYVTALAALLRGAHSDESAIQIRNRIISTATDLGTPGVDPSFGAGLVNPGAAIAN